LTILLHWFPNAGRQVFGRNCGSALSWLHEAQAIRPPTPVFDAGWPGAFFVGEDLDMLHAIAGGGDPVATAASSTWPRQAVSAHLLVF
jgi:hypothetical protein